MTGAVVRVPIARPAAYAPAWDEKAPGVRVSRFLDLADLLAARGLDLVNATVAVDPPLVADGFFVSDKSISFYVVDNPPVTARTRLRVRFDLSYSDGSADEIVVFQPLTDPLAGGLVPVDLTAFLLSVGGSVITIGGEPIYVGPFPPPILTGGQAPFPFAGHA